MDTYDSCLPGILAKISSLKGLMNGIVLLTKSLCDGSCILLQVLITTRYLGVLHKLRTLRLCLSTAILKPLLQIAYLLIGQQRLLGAPAMNDVRDETARLGDIDLGLRRLCCHRVLNETPQLEDFLVVENGEGIAVTGHNFLGEGACLEHLGYRRAGILVWGVGFGHDDILSEYLAVRMNLSFLSLEMMTADKRFVGLVLRDKKNHMRNWVLLILYSCSSGTCSCLLSAGGSPGNRIIA